MKSKSVNKAKRNSRVGVAELKKLQEMRAQGLSYSTIAHKSGRSVITVRSQLQKAEQNRTTAAEGPSLLSLPSFEESAQFLNGEQPLDFQAAVDSLALKIGREVLAKMLAA